MSSCLKIAVALLAASVAVAEPGAGETLVASATAGGARPLEPATLPMADRAVLHKSERRLYLMKDGAVLRSYRVALGLVPAGTKQRSGDFRTPEGIYQLTRRNPHSDYLDRKS